MRTLRVVILFLLLSKAAESQSDRERFSDWPKRTTINGRVAVALTLPDTTALSQLLPGQKEDVAVALLAEHVSQQKADEISAAFSGCEIRRWAGETNNVEEWLLQQLNDVKIFCWCSDRSEERLSPDLRKALQAFVHGGGTAVAVGPHCGVLSHRHADGDADECVWKVGADLIPDCVLTTTDKFRKSDLDAYLSIKPRRFGICLAKTGLLVLSGRKFRLLGEGEAEFQIPGCDWLPARQQVLKPQQSLRQDPNEYLVDLTEWRREAIERTLEPFPAKEPPVPYVSKGTLVIVGGGGMPAGLMNQFIDFAGGKENAKLVYVPCAEQAELPPRQGIVEMWKKMGVQHATFIHTKDRHEANTNEDILSPLRDATGIWFGGGRQWNFADSYYGTEAHRLMRAIVERGGVAGGSSAGASIQAAYLARATPIQNFRIMAPGYERGGLGFIRGVAIDQHFTQRGRQKDMTQLVNQYPQLLGIGLDEATAIIVRESRAEVTGRGDVYFYDRRQPVVDDQPDYIALAAGSLYDLAERKILKRVERQADVDQKPEEKPER